MGDPARAEQSTPSNPYAPPSPEARKERPPFKTWRTVALWIFLVLMFLFFYQYFDAQNRGESFPWGPLIGCLSGGLIMSGALIMIRRKETAWEKAREGMADADAAAETDWKPPARATIVLPAEVWIAIAVVIVAYPFGMAGVAVLGAVVYLGGPLLVLRHQAVARVEYVPYRRQSFDYAVADSVEETDQTLKRLGWSPLESPLQPKNKATSVHSLYEHAVRGQVEVSIAMEANRRTVARLLVFRTRFEDGSVRTTSNVKASWSRPTRPGHRTLAFPQVQDVERVAVVHGRLIDRFEVLPSRPFPTEGSVADRFAQMRTEAFDWLVSVRLYRRGADANRYRLTLGGAYLLVWRAFWPMSRIARARTRHEAGKMLTQLGLSA